MESAIERTYNIFELVEHILLHLPAIDLVVACTTYPYWRDVVESSSPIRHQLVSDIAKAGRYCWKLEFRPQDIWFFSTTMADGSILLVLRKPSTHFELSSNYVEVSTKYMEVFILLPTKYYTDILILDERYDRTVSRCPQSGFTDLEWRSKNGALIYKTDCKNASSGCVALFNYLCNFYDEQYYMRLRRASLLTLVEGHDDDEEEEEEEEHTED